MNELNYTTHAVNPTERLQEAFGILNTIIFCDELPYHMIVPRKTRGYKYGSFDNPTHELPVSPVYFDIGELASAELLHQMWHVWQHRYGNPPASKHESHYHNRELEERIRACGLEAVTDPVLCGLLPNFSYQSEAGTEAHAAIEYIIESGVVPRDMRATQLRRKNRSLYFPYQCPQCKWKLPRMQSKEMHELMQSGRISITCEKCQQKMAFLWNRKRGIT